MEKPHTAQIIAFIHTPMQVISAFSLLKQINKDNQEIMFALFYKNNVHLNDFIQKLLDLDKVSLNMIAPFSFLEIRFPYIFSYVKIIKNLHWKLLNLKKVELLIFPDRAHPMYRFLSVFYFFWLKDRTQILFIEEGLSHYYKDFSFKYTSKLNIIGRYTDRHYYDLYKTEKIKHYSIRLFNEFKFDLQHMFTLKDYPFIKYEIEKYVESINSSFPFVLLLPSSLEVVQELQIKDLVKIYWDSFLSNYSRRNENFTIMIKPHPVMSHEFSEDLYHHLSSKYSVVLVPRKFNFFPAEYFIKYFKQITTIIGYDSSTIVSFGPSLFGENLTYEIITNKIYSDYAKKSDMTKYKIWNKSDMELLGRFGYHHE